MSGRAGILTQWPTLPEGTRLGSWCRCLIHAEAISDVGGDLLVQRTEQELRSALSPQIPYAVVLTDAAAAQLPGINAPPGDMLLVAFTLAAIPGRTPLIVLDGASCPPEFDGVWLTRPNASASAVQIPCGDLRGAGIARATGHVRLTPDGRAAEVFTLA